MEIQVVNLKSRILEPLTNLAEIAAFSIAEILSQILGIIGTESAYSICKDGFTKRINNLFHPNVEQKNV